MKRLLLLLVCGNLALFSGQAFGSGLAGNAMTDVLSPDDSETLAYVWELHKYQRDRYLGAADCWHMTTLLPMGYDEELQLHVLGDLMTQYNAPFPSDSDDAWSYSEGFLSGLFQIMRYVCWASPPQVLRNSAYIEECEVRDLREAINGTGEQALVDAYTGALLGAYDHLRAVAGLLGDPSNYISQVLSQAEVDEILSGDTTPPDEALEINATFNDAWYYPETNGQGFFISVYPNRSEVMMGWFTFDTDLPDQGATANLGDPGQRWLTAQGTYVGNRAQLTVYSSSGGLFDTSPPTVQHEPIGSLELKFEDCSTGSVTYSLPGINEFGLIPIQRVASDNLAACESHIEQ